MSGPRPGDGEKPSSRRPGRRALFSEAGTPPSSTEAPVSEDLATGASGSPAAGAPAAGRRAFFSQAGDPSVTPNDEAPSAQAAVDLKPTLSTAVVECRTCRSRTQMPLLSLTVSLVPSLWLPLRRWPHLMHCPNCARVSWCRIYWPLVGTSI